MSKSVLSPETILHFAALKCDWCREQGPPEWKSGHDRVGGWVSGFVHTTKDGLVICAAGSFYEPPEQT